MNNQVKLKKGDWVVMHTCGEATAPDNYGKLWRCETDEYTRGEGVYEQKLVFLEGFSGCFSTDFLQKVNLPDTPPVPTIKPGDKVRHPYYDEGIVKVYDLNGDGRALVAFEDPDCGERLILHRDLELVE